jgi:cytidylate kinase
VSREPGSGGRPIAEMVAKKLKFELYDEKFIEDIAQSTKRRADLIRSIDEKARGLITDMLQSILNPDYISDMTYIRHAAKIILTRAHKGRVIFLDRGANFIIPPESALRVRIQAPYPVRVARAIKYEKIDLGRAREIIRKHDTERKEFVRQYFDKNISNANFYDIVLNTSFMTLEDARDLIIFSFKKKFRVK